MIGPRGRGAGWRSPSRLWGRRSQPEVEFVEIEVEIDFIWRRSLIAAVLRDPGRHFFEPAHGHSVPFTEQAPGGDEGVAVGPTPLRECDPQDLGALGANAAHVDKHPPSTRNLG